MCCFSISCAAVGIKFSTVTCSFSSMVELMISSVSSSFPYLSSRDSFRGSFKFLGKEACSRSDSTSSVCWWFLMGVDLVFKKFHTFVDFLNEFVRYWLLISLVE